MTGSPRHECHSCADHAPPGAPPASQSLAEVEFSRSACKAALDGDHARLQMLLDRHPEAVAQDGSGRDTGYTPLHYAARNGHALCVALLLKRCLTHWPHAVDSEATGGDATALGLPSAEART